MARILLVDDDLSLRMVVSLMLARAGHSVALAGDGEEALEMARAEMPDVVLSDLCMPGMRGDALLREVREGNPEVACILMTGDCDQELADAVRPSLLLRKPFLSTELIDSVDEALGAMKTSAYSGSGRAALAS